jgi:hypothetical protein
MLRRALVLAAWLAFSASGANLPGADPSADQYTRVIVENAKTSIYVGTVTMTMPTFVRAGSAFESTYTARVFPYFFYNESGRLTVELPDESLRKLQRGEPVDFSGRAVRDDGSERRVEGRATPTGSSQGKLKVRVIYSKRIELIFNTTYRFPDAREDVSKESPPTARP